MNFIMTTDSNIEMLIEANSPEYAYYKKLMSENDPFRGWNENSSDNYIDA